MLKHHRHTQTQTERERDRGGEGKEGRERKEDITQKIVRTYYKNLYSTKLEKLKERTEFLDTNLYNTPNLNKD